MLRTFKLGGIHPHDNKISKDVKIEMMQLPSRVVIQMSQHIGAPALPIVAKGDILKVGDIIGKSAGFVSSNIHSSVSGKVVSIDEALDGSNIKRKAVTIDVEGDIWSESIDTSTTIIPNCSLSKEEIIAKITAAGIVGMGGATFPTHVKLAIPDGKTAECLIINGVECEPYLTADHRLMLERGEEMLIGVNILCKAIGVNKAYIGIENNKPDAITNLRNINKFPNIEIVALKVQYPQGSEKQLIQAIINRTVPSGALPIEVGAVVQNVGTALAVYEAVQKNKPLFERIVTVTGKGVKNPKNLLIRVGTKIEDILDYCGYDEKTTSKVISGGPMMGRAICNIAAPVTKGTSGILLMNAKEAKRSEESSCIRCGKCIKVCPMGLEPYLINIMSKKGMFNELVEHRPNDCIECGSCSYTCPSAIPLLDYIRLGKGKVMAILRAPK